MSTWRAKVKWSPTGIQVLVLDSRGNDLLKAQMPGMPRHPRALLGVLEAMAQWQGMRLPCVISVDPEVALFGVEDGWIDDLSLEGSALVRVEYGIPRSRQIRICGVGDFRSVRILEFLGTP